LVPKGVHHPFSGKLKEKWQKKGGLQPEEKSIPEGPKKVCHRYGSGWTFIRGVTNRSERENQY